MLGAGGNVRDSRLLITIQPQPMTSTFCHLEPFLSWELCPKLRVEDAKEISACNTC